MDATINCNKAGNECNVEDPSWPQRDGLVCTNCHAYAFANAGFGIHCKKGEPCKMGADWNMAAGYNFDLSFREGFSEAMQMDGRPWGFDEPVPGMKILDFQILRVKMQVVPTLSTDGSYPAGKITGSFRGRVGKFVECSNIIAGQCTDREEDESEYSPFKYQRRGKKKEHVKS